MPSGRLRHFFQSGGIEGHVAADLRDVEGDGAAAGGEGFIFETVGLALTVFGAFVRPGLERVGAFAAHVMVWCWMCLAHPNRKPL